MGPCRSNHEYFRAGDDSKMRYLRCAQLNLRAAGLAAASAFSA